MWQANSGPRTIAQIVKCFILLPATENLNDECNVRSTATRSVIANKGHLPLNLTWTRKINVLNNWLSKNKSLLDARVLTCLCCGLIRVFKLCPRHYTVIWQRPHLCQRNEWNHVSSAQDLQWYMQRASSEEARSWKTLNESWGKSKCRKALELRNPTHKARVV